MCALFITSYEFVSVFTFILYSLLLCIYIISCSLIWIFIFLLRICSQLHRTCGASESTRNKDVGLPFRASHSVARNVKGCAFNRPIRQDTGTTMLLVLWSLVEIRARHSSFLHWWSKLTVWFSHSRGPIAIFVRIQQNVWTFLVGWHSMKGDLVVLSCMVGTIGNALQLWKMPTSTAHTIIYLHHTLVTSLPRKKLRNHSAVLVFECRLVLVRSA